MSWISSIISGPGPQEGRGNNQQSQGKQRAVTRTKLVNNLREAAQGLATFQANHHHHQQQQHQSKPKLESKSDTQNQSGNARSGSHQSSLSPGGGSSFNSFGGGIHGTDRNGIGGGGTRGWKGEVGEEPVLIGGDTVEVRLVCSALEQCLFHRIRVKEFGVVPLWAFLERVERLPLSSSSVAVAKPTAPAAAAAATRNRRLSSVRNTVGAVASFGNVNSPLGRARAWVRQCLVSKCLEACIAAMLEEDRLVKVFYEPTALIRCREGSSILLRLCSALEAFDVSIDADQSALDTQPRWPILDDENERDRRAEAAAEAAAAAAAAGGRGLNAYGSADGSRNAYGNATARGAHGGAFGDVNGDAYYGSAAGQSSHDANAAGSGSGSGSWPAQVEDEKPWFQQQQERQHRQQKEEGRGPPERGGAGGWAASALSDIDQLAKGDWPDKLDDVVAAVNSKVDQAVLSLEDTIHELFGDNDNSNNGQGSNTGQAYNDPSNYNPSLSSSSQPKSASNSNNPAHAASRRVLDDGWVELRGGNPSQASSTLLGNPSEKHATADYKTPVSSSSGYHNEEEKKGGVSSSSALVSATGGGPGYPEAFGLGSGEALGLFGPAGSTAGVRGRARQGKGRLFGVSLEELVLNPERCTKGVLDPALGVPDALLSLIEALRDEGCRNTPGLFLEEASEADLLKVVKSLEKKNKVPTAASLPPSSSGWLVSKLKGAEAGGGGGGGASGAVSPHAIASALVYFLHRLPDPLLTFQRREAFLSCESIPEREPRVRNVKLLVEDLPSSYKPLLLALVDLFSDIAQPLPAPFQEPFSFSETGEGEKRGGGNVTVIDIDETDVDLQAVTSGVTVRDAAETLAPALLRAASPTAGMVGGRRADGGREEVKPIRPDWEEELTAAGVVELILSEHGRVLEGMRTAQRLREERLSRKIKRLGQLQKMLAASVYLERSSHLAIVISIWRRLEHIEREMQEEAATGGEDALGLNSYNPTATTTTVANTSTASKTLFGHEEHPGKNPNLRADTVRPEGEIISPSRHAMKASASPRPADLAGWEAPPSVSASASAPLPGGLLPPQAATAGTEAPAVAVVSAADIDQDVRDLENMFLGLDGGDEDSSLWAKTAVYSEESCENIPMGELTLEDVDGPIGKDQAAASAAGLVVQEGDRALSGRSEIETQAARSAAESGNPLASFAGGVVGGDFSPVVVAAGRGTTAAELDCSGSKTAAGDAGGTRNICIQSKSQEAEGHVSSGAPDDAASHNHPKGGVSKRDEDENEDGSGDDSSSSVAVGEGEGGKESGSSRKERRIRRPIVGQDNFSDAVEGEQPGRDSSGVKSPSALVAFTIEEDDDVDGEEKKAGHAAVVVPPPGPFLHHLEQGKPPSGRSFGRSADDNDSTLDLLDSIDATLTPSASAIDGAASAGGAGDDSNAGGDGDSSGGGPLLVTRSELALVSLMTEAGEEDGELLRSEPAPESRRAVPSIGGGVVGGHGDVGGDVSRSGVEALSRRDAGGFGVASLLAKSATAGSAVGTRQHYGSSGRSPSFSSSRPVQNNNNSSFDDALSSGSTPFGSSAAAAATTTSAAGSASALGGRRIASEPGVMPSSSNSNSSIASPRAADRGVRDNLGGGFGTDGPASNIAGCLSSSSGSSVSRLEGRGVPDAKGHPGTSERSGDGAAAAAATAAASGVSLVAKKKRVSLPPAFSLGHERWVTCGFTAGFTASKGGHEACVARALRGTSTVLALDSVNYFLKRYPRSAARTVRSFARRHAIARGGGDSCPFPMHAGDITRVISDLLSLPPASTPPSSSSLPPPPPSLLTSLSSSSSSQPSSGLYGETPWVTDGAQGEAVEPDEARALRLAALPTWRLMDAPNAFHEAFVCAVLVLEAAQAGGVRGHHPLRYEESLLEMRRVLRACFLHAPTSVDGLWAAAAAEGGVFPDPGDKSPTSPITHSTDKDGHKKKEEAGVGGREGGGYSRVVFAEELVRVLGLSELDLREEDLKHLGGNSQASASSHKSFIPGHSEDDRLSRSLRGGGSTASPSLWSSPSTGDGGSGSCDGGGRCSCPGRPHASGSGTGGGTTTTSSSSDWLLAGEAARTGMLESVTAENSEQSGPLVVDDGLFQARLLCPSQILSAEDVRALAGRLPSTVASSDWVSLYSDARHGSSLKTLLARCAGWEPTLVIVEASVPSQDKSVANRPVTGDYFNGVNLTSGFPGEEKASMGTGGEKTPPPTTATAAATAGAGVTTVDSSGGDTDKESARRTAVFGGFASGSQWKNMGRGFAGDGRSFLFSFDTSTQNKGGQRGLDHNTAEENRNNSRVGNASRRGSGSGGSSLSGSCGALNVYAWGGYDRCFITSDDGVGMGMGGGGKSGNFGFFLEADLRKGSTGECKTFGNPPLVAGAVTDGESPGGVGGAARMDSGVFEILSLEVWGFRPAKTPVGFDRISL